MVRRSTYQLVGERRIGRRCDMRARERGVLQQKVSWKSMTLVLLGGLGPVVAVCIYAAAGGRSPVGALGVTAAYMAIAIAAAYAVALFAVPIFIWQMHGQLSDVRDALHRIAPPGASRAEFARSSPTPVRRNESADAFQVGRWRVDGVDYETGIETGKVVQAESRDDAVRQATQVGIAVTSVRPADAFG
jgi:hypothetical protein